jgi:uncharacterized membrane protein YgcG
VTKVRKNISPETQAEILAESRRRCPICYALDRDLRRKSGQIAHLDQDRANNERENLVFLCLAHHDEFDSRTSQSKGLTVAEVRLYQSQLVEELRRQWESGLLDPLPSSPTPPLVMNLTLNAGAGGAGGAGGGGGGGGGGVMGGGGAGGYGGYKESWHLSI